MLKRILVMFVLAVSLIFLGGQDNQAEAANGYVTNIRTYLSIRAEPTIYSRELVRVPNGTSLEIINRYGDFYYVYVGYCQIYGYAHCSYVRYY